MNKIAKLMLAMAVMTVYAVAWAVEVTPEQAQTAVRNWIRKNPRPMTAQFNTCDGEARTFSKDGRALFHVVQLEGGGFVVTSGDTKISPIVAFSDGGTFDDDLRNPLFALLNMDMAGRIDLLDENISTTKTIRLLAALPQDKFTNTGNERIWDELLVDAADAKGRVLLSSVASSSQLDDVYVEPMIETEWDQSYWGRNRTTLNTYNYYTPTNYVCGCVATAGAQIMKYWEYPKSNVEPKSYSCFVDGRETMLKMEGGSYAWSLMPLKYDDLPNITETQRKAIGKLTYDIGVASHMSYTSEESGSFGEFCAQAFQDTFGYKSASAIRTQLNIGSGKEEQFRNSLLASLDAGMPVMLGITGNGGHQVVADGYGYKDGHIYVHLNCGWSGKYWSYGDQNVWYDIFTLSEKLTDPFDFSVLSDIEFNIHPTETGDVISGRVLDAAGRPVSGASVFLSKGSTTKTTITNSKGVYSFRITSIGEYSLSAKSGTKESKLSLLTVLKLSENARLERTSPGRASILSVGYSANKWGNDLILESKEDVIPDDPVIAQVAAPVFSPTAGSFASSSLSVTISCGTSGATIYYTKDGSTPTTSSTKYTGAITISATTTFKAIAVKSGMSNSDIVVKTYTKNKPTISVANALDDTSRTYTVSDSANAYGQDDVTHDGTDALKLSCAKTSGSKTSVTATFNGAGTLSFWWCDPSATPQYSSSNPSTIIGYNNYYYCTVTKSDGTEYGQWKCDGPAWQKCEIPLMAGTYTVEWSVSAGAWIFAAARTSYLDEVSFVQYSGGSRKVTFNANGGSGTPEKSSATAAFGESVKVSGQGTLERDGYKFVGWSTSPDASKAEYDISESVQVGASDILLYAVWKKWISVLVEIPQSGGEAVQSLSLYGNSYVAYISFPSWASNFKMTGKTSSGGTTTLSLGNGRSRLSISGDLSLTFEAGANDTAEDRSFDLDMDALDYPYVIRYHVAQKADVVSDKPKGLVVYGASSILSSSAATFSSQVVRRNGSVGNVSPTWSIASGGSYATVSSSGKLTAKSVTSPKTVVLNATYSESGVDCSTSREVTILPTCDLNAALDNNSLMFQTGTGVNAWFGQYDVSNDGIDAARASSALGGTPWLKTVVESPATVSFDCLMSADDGNVLYFVDNGITNECAFSVANTISFWQHKSFELVGDGNHVVELIYAHGDGPTGVAGGDAAWVDNFVVVKPVVYAITYEPGSYGSGSEQTSQKVEDVALTLKDAIFTRLGYTQTGWTTSDGGVKRYDLSEPYTANADITLYPYWTPNTYSITLDRQSGTSGSTGVSATYSNEMPSITPPTRTGYTFGGYFTGKSGSGTKYYNANGSSAHVWDKTDATTLYAYWTVNQYTVTFNANGGTGGTTKTQDYGTALVAPTVTRTGYDFKGWSPSVPSTMPAASATYVAQWEAHKHTVTFDANGGTGGVVRTQDYGSAIVAPTVTRTGYTFKGWSPSVAATVPDNDVTYTAQWEINQYTVTFNANGGTGGTTKTQDYGTALVAPTVTRTGYDFKGWSPSVPSTMPAASATYVAQWEAHKHTVIFDANGGTGGVVRMQDYGSAIVVPTVTRTGYTFKGWSPSVAATVPDNDVTYTAQWEINQYTVTFDANGGTGGTTKTQDYGTALVAPTVTRTGYLFKYWSPSVPSTMPAENATYTALWASAWILTLDANGGALAGDGSILVEKGKAIDELPTPIWDRHAFLGWYTAAIGGTKVTSATKPTADVTYYAHWLYVGDANNDNPIVFELEASYGAESDGSFLLDLSEKIGSMSELKLTVSGLPAGLKYDAKTMTISGNATKPGVYTVTVSATNATVKKPVTATFDIVVPNFKDAEIPVADSYGPFVPGVSCVTDIAAAAGCAVSGLPAGMKWDSKAAAVSGAPTKPGNYTVTFTKTVGGDKHVATATFVVGPFPKLTVVTGGSGTGKVTGAGEYVANKKVSLKATPDTGCIFMGWYDGDTLLSQSASYSYVMPSSDKTITAKFITVEEDRASITLSLGGMDLDSPSVAPVALATNITCGVALERRLAAGALSATTVKVAGLPAGLKFAAKDVVDPKTKQVTVKANTIYGAPTAASKVGKDGKPTPSDVKITVTTAGKSSVTYLVKLTVDPLPAWAVGTFDGEVESGGIVQAFTVATSGKISGKILEGGKTWALSAPNFSRAEYAEGGPEPEVPSPSFFATVIGKAGKEVVTNEVEVAGAVVQGVEVGVASSDGWSAWQNLWSRPDTKAEMPVFRKSFDVTLESGLKLTFKKNGAVSFAGKVEGVSVSGSSQLVFADDGNWHVTLYAPPKGQFPGMCITISVVLVVDEQNIVIDVVDVDLDL